MTAFAVSSVAEILESLAPLTCRRSAFKASGQARHTLRPPRLRGAHCVRRDVGRSSIGGLFIIPLCHRSEFPIHLDTLRRGSRIRARVRWTDPFSRERGSRSVTVDDDVAAREFFELIRTSSSRTVGPLITLNDYSHSIGDRFLRGVDPTSTVAGYRAGLRLRVLPALGHIRLRDVTTGLVDRATDSWETAHTCSTLKNTIAALTRVLDKAVRDDLIARDPVRDRADRRYRANMELPHTKLIPGPGDVARIAEACAEIHPSYGDHVMSSAFMAARSSEVGGLLVGDVNWASKIVTIEQQ